MNVPDHLSLLKLSGKVGLNTTMFREDADTLIARDILGQVKLRDSEIVE
jgi:hypothetical protein